MNGAIAGRRAIALPAALVAVIALSALAALSNFSALASLREAAALADATQRVASRQTLSARATVQLLRTPRAQLLAGPRALGLPDTTMTVFALVWPWHRFVVSAAGAPVVAGFARAVVPPASWCAAVVIGGASTVAPGTLTIDPHSACAGALAAATPLAISVFSDSLAASLALGTMPDTLVVGQGSPVPAVVRARRSITVTGTGSLIGLAMAPVIRLLPGAAVRGLLVASDSLWVPFGAGVVADTAAVNAVLASLAGLRPLGRGGLLLPP